MSTIKQVADLAHVSIGTVSHVISGSVPVSDNLRKRVQDAIRLLDYHPNHIARSLKTRRTCTLGIIIPDMTIPFFPKVVRGAETAAQTFGYSVIAIDSNDNADRQREVVSLLRSQRVEGILLVVASGEDSLAQLPKLVHSGLPIVCLDRLPGGVDVDSVCVEDRAAAEMGVAHLIEMGHTSIAIVTGDLTLKNEQQRLLGYKSAFEKAALPVDASLIWEASLRPGHAFEVCRQNLSSTATRPTALFATNGVTGLGALRGMLECGLQTPEDIAFVSFDELTAEEVFRPSITSIVQPAYDIGYRAAEILIERIQKGTVASIDSPRIEIRLPATLKIRESSRHPFQNPFSKRVVFTSRV
jgi:DNA-binding LacI/PurR family transcriptional regulator